MSIGSGIHVLHRSRACEGLHVVLGGQMGGQMDEQGHGRAPELGLATLLGELEAEGARPTAVTLRVARAEDSGWATAALRWLHAHGRRALVRTSRALPRPLIEGAEASGATVLLELAHHRPEMQRALLGPEATAASALLLQAQHLVQRGIGVVAGLGPLMPGIHDVPGQLAPLLHHLRAADLHHVHLSVGQLTGARLRAVAAIDEGLALGLRRAFGVDAGGGEAGSEGPWRLSRLARAALHEGVRVLVREHGARVDACGCGAQCLLDGGGRPAYVPVLAGELFAASGAES